MPISASTDRGEALDPPGERVGTDAMWDAPKRITTKVLRDRGAVGRPDQDLHQPGRRRLLRPEIRICLRDAIGRDWQCGTTQVDFNLPQRFDAFYIAADGRSRRR